MPRQRQRERALGLVPGQPRRRVEHGAEPVAVGQLAGLGRQRAGDGLELVAARQVVVDQDEQLLQLDGDRHDRREDDDERPVLLAGVDPGVEGLDDLGGVQEPVEVPEHEDGRAVGRGQGAQREDRGQGVGRLKGRGGLGGLAGQGEAAVDVPGGQRPVLLAAEAGDLGDRVVVLEGLDVDAGERGAHEFLQALGERHGVSCRW